MQGNNENLLSKLINLTNHPYSEWSEEQREAARKYGECIDIPFPAVDSDADSDDISRLAERYLHQISEYGQDVTVHVMGEQTFCFALISMLIKKGITCIASATTRDVTILPDGSRKVHFHFSRFREYK